MVATGYDLDLPFLAPEAMLQYVHHSILERNMQSAIPIYGTILVVSEHALSSRKKPLFTPKTQNSKSTPEVKEAIHLARDQLQPVILSHAVWPPEDCSAQTKLLRLLGAC